MPAQSTVIANGIDCSFQVDNAAGTITDISGETNNVVINQANELGVGRTLGQAVPCRFGGLKDITIDFTVYYSNSDAEGFGILQDWYDNYSDTARTVEVYVPENTAGADKFDGEFKLASFNFTVDASSANPIECTGTLEVHSTWNGRSKVAT